MRVTGMLLLILAYIVPAVSAHAEPVLIESATGQKGQGWLFGSPTDGRCWIATPRHVVEADGRLADFLWRDLRGIEGTGYEPQAATEPLDLSFARVAGREAGACLSRLGPDDLTRFVTSQPLVWAQAMFRTHLRVIEMRLTDANSQFVQFEPTHNEDLDLLRKGLSGTPLILRKTVEGVDRPIGLVTKIDGQKSVGFALRFDLIKSEFARVAITGVSGAHLAEGIANGEFKLIDVTGRSRSPAEAPAAALNDSGCWVAHPANGKRSYSAVIQPVSAESVVIGLSILFDASCGARPDGLIVQAPEGDGLWVTVASCEISQEAAKCAVGRRRATPLRLIVIKRDGGDAAIKRITLRSANSK